MKIFSTSELIYNNIHQQEEFYTCTWSMLDGTQEPIVAAAGKLGIVRLLLYVEPVSSGRLIVVIHLLAGRQSRTTYW